MPHDRLWKLMVAIALLGVVLAVVQRPGPVLCSALYSCFLLSLIAACVMAVASGGSARTAWMGYALSGALYFAASILPLSWVGNRPSEELWRGQDRPQLLTTILIQFLYIHLHQHSSPLSTVTVWDWTSARAVTINEQERWRMNALYFQISLHTIFGTLAALLGYAGVGRLSRRADRFVPHASSSAREEKRPGNPENA